jgi:uncharacterized membrane protein
MLLLLMVLASNKDALVLLAQANAISENFPQAKERRMFANALVMVMVFLVVIGVATMSTIATMILMFHQLQIAIMDD